MNRRTFIKLMGAMVVTIPTISMAVTAPKQHHGATYIDTLTNKIYTFDGKWNEGVKV